MLEVIEKSHIPFYILLNIVTKLAGFGSDPILQWQIYIVLLEYFSFS